MSSLTDGICLLLIECLLTGEDDFEVSYLDDVFLFRREGAVRFVALNSATFESADNVSISFMQACVNHELGWNPENICLGVPGKASKVRLGFLKDSDPVLGVLVGTIAPLSKLLDAMHKSVFGDA